MNSNFLETTTEMESESEAYDVHVVDSCGQQLENIFAHWSQRIIANMVRVVRRSLRLKQKHTYATYTRPFTMATIPGELVPESNSVFSNWLEFNNLPMSQSTTVCIAPSAQSGQRHLTI